MAIKKRPTGNPFRKHAVATYRSGLEVAISLALAAMGVNAAYEQVRIPFVQPAKNRHYTPDWALPNGVVVEAKGIWDSDDRAKHALIRQQYPDLDVRLVFTNPNARISKASPTTYAMVCEKMGMKYAKKEVPPAWINEPSNERSLAVLATLGWTPSA